MSTTTRKPDASSDRNLLFGIPALQMDLIDRDQLVAAMSAWALDRGGTNSSNFHSLQGRTNLGKSVGPRGHSSCSANPIPAYSISKTGSCRSCNLQNALSAQVISKSRV
jgi:hypothetical protein